MERVRLKYKSKMYMYIISVRLVEQIRHQSDPWSVYASSTSVPYPFSNEFINIITNTSMPQSSHPHRAKLFTDAGSMEFMQPVEDIWLALFTDEGRVCRILEGGLSSAIRWRRTGWTHRRAFLEKINRIHDMYHNNSNNLEATFVKLSEKIQYFITEFIDVWL